MLKIADLNVGCGHEEHQWVGKREVEARDLGESGGTFETMRCFGGYEYIGNKAGAGCMKEYHLHLVRSCIN
jgi:hypothetical protein